MRHLGWLGGRLARRGGSAGEVAHGVSRSGRGDARAHRVGRRLASARISPRGACTAPAASTGHQPRAASLAVEPRGKAAAGGCNASASVCGGPRDLANARSRVSARPSDPLDEATRDMVIRERWFPIARRRGRLAPLFRRRKACQRNKSDRQVRIDQVVVLSSLGSNASARDHGYVRSGDRPLSTWPWSTFGAFAARRRLPDAPSLSPHCRPLLPASLLPIPPPSVHLGHLHRHP